MFLTGKGGSYSYPETAIIPPNSGSGSGTPPIVTQKLAIQYLEIPATIKLSANEVAPAARRYFQVGGLIAFPLSMRINGDKYFTDSYNSTAQTDASSHVFAVDANLIGGLGVEYQLSKSTQARTGLSYHHGLVDLDRYFEKDRGFSDVSLKNSVFALDPGLKF